MTVTGVDDDLVDGTVNSTVTIAVDDANSDDDFDAVADQAVTASTTDDDVLFLILNQTATSFSQYPQATQGSPQFMDLQ